MLNLVSVLQLLCAKVKQDKVDPVYLYTDTCSLSLDNTDDSRLKSTSITRLQGMQGKGREREGGTSSTLVLTAPISPNGSCLGGR